MNKIKQYAVIGVFILFICGFSIAHFLLPDKDFSVSERKQLTQAPVLSWEAIRTGDYFADAEIYFLDQFPLRPQFLDTKRILDKNIFLMSSSSGYTDVNGHLTKVTPTLNEDEVEHTIKLLNNFLKSHPQIHSAHCAVIPDKNYFITQVKNQPSLDYNALFEMVKAVEAEQIPITHLLSLDDYYFTDSHWKQERLLPVVEAICNALGVPAADPDSYHAESIDGFKGVYYELTESPPDPETLTYLYTDTMNNALVKRLNQYMKMEEGSMYEPEALHDDGRYGYDFFLEGPAPLLTIENDQAMTDRHLIILCDSFGSSFAPLMTDSFSKITLLDFRYAKTYAVNSLGIDFEDADVLILYSTTIFNTSRTAGME